MYKLFYTETPNGYYNYKVTKNGKIQESGCIDADELDNIKSIYNIK